jgi:Kef-type K+ transport system membrane component KefB
MKASMTLSTTDVAHVLLALGALLVAAHLCGSIFARFRQPRVIGEILGGLLLGPTVLGAIAPGVQAWLFPPEGPTANVLGAVYQLGLLLLLFVSGVEIHAAFNRKEGKAVTSISIAGMLLPFAAGLVALHFLDLHRYWGTAQSSGAFLLVFAIAVAVTSIPVISRIMHDLGILDTSFARVVLGVAVLEDVVLYVLLAIALGIVSGTSGESFGLPALIGLEAGSAADIAYHVVATLAVLALFLTIGPKAYRVVSRSKLNPISHGSPVAHQLVFLLFSTVLCLFLGVEAFFGALLAGIVVGARKREPASAIEAVKGFSFAFFIPAYFAIVGLQLDLIRGFEPLFFIGFLLFACVAKALSVYLGARIGGEPARTSLNLAIALNARGGPGIVLASVAFGAGIINEPFYAVLVLLAIITSLAAGSWLERVPRSELVGAEDVAADGAV